MKTIVVEPYNPEWAKEFEKIENEILPVIAGDILSFEHVGSTSVPGMWAKPVIDIDVVTDGGKLPDIIKKLAVIGYCHRGDLGIAGREAFGYNAEEKPQLMKHHLYVCQKDSVELRRHIALRDFLKANREYREKYSRIKVEMAQKYPHDIDCYIEGKEPVILEIYEKCGL